MSDYKHQSIRDYADALRRGDGPAASRIVTEIGNRIAAGTADSTEITELFTATKTTPIPEPS
ncbi:MAG: hypothetical protein LC792_18250 [Actinobacteria bacterium]|nr:hypothetical protein [Actinomycetota bacterium]